MATSPRIIEIPGVGNVEFPASMSDDQITSAIKAMPEVQGSTQKSQKQTGPKSNPLAFMGIPQPVTDVMSEVSAGAVKGAGSTAYNLTRLTNHGIRSLLPESLANALVPALPEKQGFEQAVGKENLLTPINTAQKVGYTGEQVGEFLVPGGAVGKAGKAADAAIGAARLPGALSSLLRIGSRAGLEGASAAGVSAAQGGDPVASGLVAGTMTGAGRAVSEVAPRLAPRIAESALGITDRMRGRGRTIGKAALSETRGVRPATVARQAKSQLDQLTRQMEGEVSRATQSGVRGTTQPAHDVLNDAIRNAPRNARSLRQKLSSLRQTLDLAQVRRGQARRFIHTPDELLEIKRGIDAEIKTWAPEWQRSDAVQRARQGLYRAIDNELDRLVPGNDALNQRISSLIPVKKQAIRKSQAAPLTQRLAHRAAAHTGALASSGIGAALGYQHGGREGALLGATAGLVAPELLTSPTAQMTAARLASDAPAVVNHFLPFFRGIFSQQAGRKNPGE